jgi:hypothetical protein
MCEVERLASPKLENFLPYHAVWAGLLAGTQRLEAARAACCKALAFEPNPAGRRWLERKAALLVTPLRVFTGEEGFGTARLANARSGPAGTVSSAGDQLQQRRRMEGAHQ